VDSGQTPKVNVNRRIVQSIYEPSSQKSGDPKEISTVDREEGHQTIDLVERSNTRSRSRVVDLGGWVSIDHQLRKIDVRRKAGFEN
jgi:hypothetical protein